MRLAALMFLGALGCRNGRGADSIRFETSLHDPDVVCVRVKRVLESSDEGMRRLDLPAVAEGVVQNAGRSSAVRECGDRLLSWLEEQLRVRPIDLRPRLESRVLALEPFLVISDSWRQRALESLAGLLLDVGAPTVHWTEDFTYLGPGSQRISLGRSAIVSPSDLDRWAAFTLHRGNSRYAYLLGQRWSWTQDTGYVDLVVRYFVQRYEEPTTWGPPMPSLEFPWGMRRSAPPPPEKLGLGSEPMDLLWSDLVRVFVAIPGDPRLRRLSTPLYGHLRRSALRDSD